MDMIRSNRRIDVKFVGTTVHSPEEFINSIESKFDCQDVFRMSLVNQENGFTYEVVIFDVTDATTKHSGEITVKYFDMMDKEKIQTVTLPEIFGIVDITCFPG